MRLLRINLLAQKGLIRSSKVQITITRSYLYNFDPLKSHFYKVKLEFTQVYTIFLISAQNIDRGYSLKRLAEAVLTSTHDLCFEQKYEKYQRFFSEDFQFLEVKFSLYLNRHGFLMPAQPITLINAFLGFFADTCTCCILHYLIMSKVADNECSDHIVRMCMLI